MDERNLFDQDKVLWFYAPDEGVGTRVAEIKKNLNLPTIICSKKERTQPDIPGEEK